MTDRPVAVSPRIDWNDLPGDVRSAVEAALGGRVVSAVTQTGGFSPGTAARVRLEDGRRAFVKAVAPSLNPDSPMLHRREARALGLLTPEVPAPRLLAVLDDGDWVALVLEDVEGRHPHLPWSGPDVAAMSEVLTALAGVHAPAGLSPFAEVALLISAWDEVAADSEGVDESLLARLPEMLDQQAVAREVTQGEALVHWDARADNILRRDDGQVVLLDWAWACRGARWLDAMLLAVDFVVQGGPDPDRFLRAHPVTRSVPPPHLRAVLACMVGVWVERSRRPAPPGLPTIRAWQSHCAGATLSWLDHGSLWG